MVARKHSTPERPQRVLKPRASSLRTEWQMVGERYSLHEVLYAVVTQTNKTKSQARLSFVCRVYWSQT